MRFQLAIQAIIQGNTKKLTELLTVYPDLIYQRANAPHRATLLHYLAANGVEPELQKSPANAVEIAEILLQAGADPNASAPIYGEADTTLELLVSSFWPYLAGVQADLAACLIAHGAAINGLDGKGAPLGTALAFGYTQTAERLASLGAKHDNVLFAAGLGERELLRSFFDEKGKLKGDTWRYPQHASDAIGRFAWPPPANPNPLAAPFVFAALHGRDEVLTYLLGLGVEPNISMSFQQTALHFASYAGHVSTVKLLLAAGAQAEMREKQFEKTAREWAEELGQKEVMGLL